MSYRAVWWFGMPAIIASASVASAVQYFTVEQAQQLMFPQASHFVSFKLPGSEHKIWKAYRDAQLMGYFVLDEVIGKHELITYAIALDPSRSVKGIEILDYRETRGGEVRDERWRAQFSGRTFENPPEIGANISNISGATLSSMHITEGVRKVLTILHEVPDDHS